MPPFFTPWAGPVQPDQFDVFAPYNADDFNIPQVSAN